MVNALAPVSAIGAQIEQVLISGNLQSLTSEQRVSYYNAVCESVGLNPLTRPFEYLTLNGKLLLYARRDCTDQLRQIHGVSIAIAARELVEGVYVVTARATTGTGRADEAIGAVPIDGLKGEPRANAMMKAETKAKRRVTLSVCGLGMLDENEVDSVPGAQREAYSPPPKADVPCASGPDWVPAPAPPSSDHDPVTGEVLDDNGEENILDRVWCNEWNERDEKWEPVREESRLSPEQLKKIHVLRGKLGHHMDRRVAGKGFYKGPDGKMLPNPGTNEKDGKYRAKLREYFGKESSKELSRREAGRAIDWLEGLEAKLNKRVQSAGADIALGVAELEAKAKVEAQFGASRVVGADDDK